MNDEEPGFFTPPPLADCSVAILGLGLMGGSLALALRGRCRRLLGSDPDPATRELAINERAVDQVSANPADLLPQADLVVLAAPVRAILRLLADLPAMHPGRAVVIDLGSTKRQVVAAMQALPARFDPLGGHPMCGREKGGLSSADPTLFQNRTFAFAALERTSQAACHLAEELARAVEAQALWLDSETHDRWTAASSHLPYLVSNALASATPDEVAPMIGTGFLSATRLAVSPGEMMADVLLTNRDYLLAALARFRTQLDRLEACLAADDDAALRALLRSGALQRERLVSSS